MVLPGDVFQAAANLVDDAALHLGLRKHSPDGLAEAVQPVNAGQEDIGHAPVLQVGQDAQPEVGSFATVAEPVAQDVSLARHIHAQNVVDSGVGDPAFPPQLDMDGVQVNDG